MSDQDGERHLFSLCRCHRFKNNTHDDSLMLYRLQADGALDKEMRLKSLHTVEEEGPEVRKSAEAPSYRSCQPRARSA